MTTEKEINIIELKYPENVRTRHGMYLGTTENPNIGLREIIDNAVDELLGSIACNKIDIQIKPGQIGSYYVISDNGRGIPIILDKDRQITKTELAMTTINAGSKFTRDKGISTGTNGTGASAFVAVCNDYFVLSKVTKDNFDKSIREVKEAWNQHPGEELFYMIRFKKGIKVDETCMSYEAINRLYDFKFPSGMSTVVAFIPDDTIYESTVANYSKKSLSYIQAILKYFHHKDSEITIDGKRVTDEFQMLRHHFITDVTYDDDQKDIHQSAKFLVTFETDKDLGVVDLSGSVNSLIVNRGLHINWAANAFTSTLKEYFGITHDHLSPGLKMSVICLTPNADFSSQTKENCVSIDRLHYQDALPIFRKEFRKIFKANYDEFELHVRRLNELALTLTNISAINKVKQLVGTVDGGSRTRSKLPSSVKDAASNNRSQCELFIVEGRSASGTMLKSRNPEIHAIMELRGVPLNSINLDLDQIMENAEMRNIITAIGAGVNEYFRIENCRYGKIILAADSDIDGERINSMILGFLAKKMTFLLEDERVFIALAPLYQQGKVYSYPGENPKDKIDFNKPFKRYKGLGEINPPEAKDFFFNENRNLLLVTPRNLDFVFKLLSMSTYRKALMIRNDIVIDKYNTGIV